MHGDRLYALSQKLMAPHDSVDYPRDELDRNPLSWCSLPMVTFY